jgi:nicotinate-nucleotide pyrophosphorylase (carboxylating)
VGRAGGDVTVRARGGTAVTYRELGTATVELLEQAGLDIPFVRNRVMVALDEDLAYGPDVTTRATVPRHQTVEATISSRASGVVAGLPVVHAVFDLVIGAGEWLQHPTHLNDGAAVSRGDTVLGVIAPAGDLLTAERTALNFLCHLSGVATLTAEWARAVAPARVRDTRKTHPGLRVLQKYAVRCGGGVNHRMGLGDAALIKDNHVVACGGITAAIAAVRASHPDIPLEVECDGLSQVDEAIAAGASLILLDNMSVSEMRESVRRGRAASSNVSFEASGGLTLAMAAEVAGTGVDFVAVGALTHSAPVLDLGLDVHHVVAEVAQSQEATDG